MDCAREMRGTNSIAKLMMPRSLSAWTSLRRAYGCMKPMTTAPLFSSAICCTESGCTVSTTSDCSSTADAEGAQVTLL